MPPLAATGWRVFRIVSSRFPAVTLFDRVADPADLDAVYQLESLTNDRIRNEVGNLNLVPRAERVSGPGTTAIMAAFTHLHPDGARFTDGSFGAFYAARELATAVAETRHHRERFLLRTDEPPQDIDMRVYVARLDGDLHDLRRGRVSQSDLLAPDSYAAGQAFGRTIRESGSNGLVYPSVRREGGTCVAVYRPRCLTKCTQERHLAYRWDGTRITDVYEKREYRAR